MDEPALRTRARREQWGTRIGAILAVTGSAVGLGNFLRFPGLAAEHGGGVFMIPYIVCFLLLGLPIAWVEWGLGRYGGARGFNSAPGVFAATGRSRVLPFFGVLGPLIPVIIYMYYVFIEAWCLGYAWHYLSGKLTPAEIVTASGEVDPSRASAYYDKFFTEFVGAGQDGFLVSGAPAAPEAAASAGTYDALMQTPVIGSFWESAVFFLVICFVLNFALIYRGLTKGIELFCKIAMPALVVCALVVLVRVLTLGTPDPDKPEQNLVNGLGYMWNPTHDAATLAPGDSKVQAALAAAGPAAVVEGDVAAGAAFDTVRIVDAPAFQSALARAGWRPLGEVPWGDDATRAAEHPLVEGRWTASRSRLRFDVSSDTATISTPGFLEALFNAKIWLAAAGQIFFSLSVGFGIVITYASYLRRNDDVALSSLTAAAGNGWCEVALGGLIVIPATFMFLGPSTVANPPGTFGMGFVSLPNVFSTMPGGTVIGFLFFFLLFLAAITSSLSMLQPAIAFLEESLGIGRRASVALLGFITIVGAAFVVYFSQGFTALGTLDFWVGTFCIYVMATVQVILFAWVLGIEKGKAELDRGAAIRIPGFVMGIVKYVSPLLLLAIFAVWLVQEMPGTVRNLLSDDNPRRHVELAAIGLIVLVLTLFTALIAIAGRRWQAAQGYDEPAHDAEEARA